MRTSVLFLCEIRCARERERERDAFLLILPARKSGEKEERMEMMMVMRGCTWRGRLTGN